MSTTVTEAQTSPNCMSEVEYRLTENLVSRYVTNSTARIRGGSPHVMMAPSGVVYVEYNEGGDIHQMHKLAQGLMNITGVSKVRQRYFNRSKTAYTDLTLAREAVAAAPLARAVEAQ